MPSEDGRRGTDTTASYCQGDTIVSSQVGEQDEHTTQGNGLDCRYSLVAQLPVARHSFATLILEAGVPMECIAKMLGYSSISSTDLCADYGWEDCEGYGETTPKILDNKICL